MRFFAPCPVFRHLRPGYGLDARPDLGLVQYIGTGPSRVIPATHVADLVDSALERGNPAANEGPQQIVGRHSLLLKLGDNLVNMIDFRV